LRDIEMPQTEIMLIVADPDRAFRLSFLPNNGIGLLRLEFMINNAIGIHPMALQQFDELKDEEAREKIEHLTRGYENKSDFFVERLAQGVATLAAEFEPTEENPMLGFRGASRYSHDLYRDGFELECRAMKMVREEMGLDNVKLMIPFCRTLEEGKKVIEIMEHFGLKRGQNGLEIYVMVEIPSNVVLAREFAEIFDGFSIGSNDLTQLALGLDRDSTIVSKLFDERNEAVKRLIAQAIRAAQQADIKIGLCGQAPSDIPEFAQFLVEEGISSISFNADALLPGLKNTKKAEQQMLAKAQE